jgi:hypothetical protein
MATLEGFPYPRPLPRTLPTARCARPRAFRLRRAKAGFAIATDMETLEGFPYLPAFRLRRAKPGFAIATDMETLEGFPYLPAFRLRRAKPGFAIATDMETLEGFPYLPAFRLRRAKPGFAIAIRQTRTNQSDGIGAGGLGLGRRKIISAEIPVEMMAYRASWVRKESVTP